MDGRSGRRRVEALHDVDLTLPTAIVVGAEGTGLRRLVRERCDWVVSIPMGGHVESLNVSVATGIVLFEGVRQRGRRPARHPAKAVRAMIESKVADGPKKLEHGAT